MIRSTFLVLCGAVAIGTARLGAQVQPTPQSPPPMAGQREHGGQRGARRGGMHRVLRDITLSEAQRTQIAAIESRYREQFRALRSSARPAAGDSVARQTSFRAAQSLRERQMAEVRGVLTSAQQATFDRNVNAWKTRIRDRRAAGTATGTTAR